MGGRTRTAGPPGYTPEEIAEIATKLRDEAGLPREPTGIVANA